METTLNKVRPLNAQRPTGPPRVLIVAGFDPSGGAGVLADVWAISKLGGSALAVVTALTAQGRTFACSPVAPKGVELQLQSALAAGAVRAAKWGMIPNRQALDVIIDGLAVGHWPIVIDPVVRTSKGERLSSLGPQDYLQLGKRLGRLHPLVLTPNREELQWLRASPTQLLALGYWAVVVKGSDSGLDQVFTHQDHWELRGSPLPRNTSHHRGTGCRFGSGLATALARGEDLIAAARAAKRLIRRFLSDPIIG